MSLAPLLAGALSGQFKDTQANTLADTLEYGLQEANRAVWRRSQGGGAESGMGATVVVALVWDGLVVLAQSIWYIASGVVLIPSTAPAPSTPMQST